MHPCLLVCIGVTAGPDARSSIVFVAHLAWLTCCWCNVLDMHNFTLTQPVFVCAHRSTCVLCADSVCRYHLQSLKQMKFFDDNTRSWWTPITGGANVPALNDLLAPHNITLGERILQGVVTLGDHKVTVRQLMKWGTYLPSNSKLWACSTAAKSVAKSCSQKSCSPPMWVNKWRWQVRLFASAGQCRQGSSFEAMPSVMSVPPCWCEPCVWCRLTGILWCQHRQVPSWRLLARDQHQ